MNTATRPFQPWIAIAALLLLTADGRAQQWTSGVPDCTAKGPLTDRHPVMPSMGALDAQAWDAFMAIVPAHGGNDENGQPLWTHQVRRKNAQDTTQFFSGWVRLIHLESNHRYRYQRYVSGWLAEQVGFYANGMADHHIFKDNLGRNAGSRRMWFENGTLALDEFYDHNGALDGRQLSWTPDGKLDGEAIYSHGTEVLVLRKPTSKKALKGGC